MRDQRSIWFMQKSPAGAGPLGQCFDKFRNSYRQMIEGAVAEVLARKVA